MMCKGEQRERKREKDRMCVSEIKRASEAYDDCHSICIMSGGYF